MSRNDVHIPDFDFREVTFLVRQSGQTVDYWHGLIKSMDAWDFSRGQRAVVFVIDTAPYFHHDDIISIGNRFARSFTGESRDGNGHGHACASVIAGLDNGQGVVGAAPDAIVVPVGGLNAAGSGGSTALANAIRYCADADLGEYNNRLRIINMSWGGSSPMDAIKQALEYAVSKGCIPVAAAGNDYGNPVGYPGAYDDLVITVGSIGRTWAPSSFTSFGKAVDLAAFGEEIMMANHKNGYWRASGTSFATPMVAGLLACIVSERYEELTKITTDRQKMVSALLQEYAKDIHQQGEDAATGAGAPVIRKEYFTAAFPDQPDQPNDDPEDPASPPERSYQYPRPIPVEIPTEFTTIWKHASSSRNHRATFTIKAISTDKLWTLPLIGRTIEAFTLWNTNRGYWIRNEDDFYRLAGIIAHFSNMMIPRLYNLQCKVEEITLTDQESGYSVTRKNPQLDMAVSKKDWCRSFRFHYDRAGRLKIDRSSIISL